MVLKVMFSEEEITKFFVDNGYSVVPHTRGYWGKGVHGRDEYYEKDIPGIVINNRVVDAEKVFENIAEYRLKKMVAPVNLETKRMIERLGKKTAMGVKSEVGSRKTEDGI